MIVNRQLPIFVGLLLACLFPQGNAMPLSNVLYLFSEVQGSVLLDGEPVEGVDIEQEYHWHWSNERQTHSVKTDAQGRFQFRAVTTTSWLARFMPHEPVIGQRITLRYQGNEHKGWVFTKHNYSNHGEVHGRPLNFVCELTAKPVANPETETFGICVLR